MAQTKSLRQKQEEREHQILGPFASYADESGGRDHEEPQCDIRTDFQRDRDRILHCKAFRRLKQKNTGLFGSGGRSLSYPFNAYRWKWRKMRGRSHVRCF